MVIEIRTSAKLRQWGNSIGIVIPIEEVRSAGLREGQEVEITVRPKTNALRAIFGTIKLDKPTDQLLREVDAELDPDLAKGRRP